MPVSRRAAIACCLLFSTAVAGADSTPPQSTTLVVPGGDGPGKGKKVVLVSGDEEYRSEEALSQLAKILATRHGFDCTVLYAIDPKTGHIDPSIRDNIPGLEALRSADLMVIATRWRNLPDAQMKEIDAYLRAGKPVVSLRTATHAFKLDSATYGHLNRFGPLVVGEDWVAHHGSHGNESTRGLVAPTGRDHPIMRGIKDGDCWGPTDVYAVKLPLAGDGKALLLGQVLSGMTPDSKPVEGTKNDPMMPVAWVRTYGIDDGPRGRAFTTTMGAATDLVAAGTRRLVVNGCYWAVGLEDKIPAESNVDLVGEFTPTKFGFNGAKKGLVPADMR
jgi:type 1 glutamine amidotransferase